MKLAGFVLGLVAAWALQKWAPSFIAFVTNTAGFTGILSGIATALTSTWVIAFNRLSAFEKLDDLTIDQRKHAQARARTFRKGILRTIAINAITLVIGLASVPLDAHLSVGSFSAAYVLFPIACVWILGFAQSISVLHNIDESRIAIVETQLAEKQKAAFLQKLRDEEKQRPVDRNDAHLKNYTQTHRYQH
ncbi:hypothetical protein KGP95_22275 [Burkholderia multivorans]|uniref:hypothetical protein n=1 Tax=Burkholderiaceae TaxID=119060 RepID=UPI00209D5EC2|nr:MULTISPECIES: hypothetical protein [Burkholderiaceae]MCO8613202.1 hypothetical protein [Burkholderia multivorans]MCO8640063.1 hypothetical protein [Burkholderia multivorans]MCO8645128.1 hypothetical protein [Burkholderia multivorans]